GCVTTAAFCLCESVPTDLRVSSAGVAVLDTVLLRRSRDGGGRGRGGAADNKGGGGGGGDDHHGSGAAAAAACGLEKAAAAGLKAASSSRVLAAVEAILQGVREGQQAGGVVPTAPTRRPDDVCEDASSCSPRSPGGAAPTAAGVARLDGCWFGAPLRGLLDAPASLLAHVVAGSTTVTAVPASVAVAPNRAVRSPSRNPAAATARPVAGLPHKRLWLRLREQLERGGSGELSPAGLACALRYAEGVVAAAPTVEDVGVLLLGAEGGGGKGGLIAMVCASVLEQRHLRAVREWPPLGGGAGGGGKVGVAAVVTAAVGAMLAPLAADGNREALLGVQQAMHAHGLVAALLGATRVLSRGSPTDSGRRAQEDEEARAAEGVRKNGGWNGGGDGGGDGGETSEGATWTDDGSGAQTEAALCACVELLSRLVLLSPHFSQQFLEEGGLGELVSAGSMREDASAGLATGALVIASQLARSSADNYEGLRDAGVVASLGGLLSHGDPTVRAKACNLVGNLCRHSAFFYAALQEVRYGGGGGGSRPDGNDNDKGVVAGGGRLPLHRARDAQLWERQQQQREGGGRRWHEQQQQQQQQQAGEELPLDGELSIVDHLVGLCADRDPSARKFACFAVGNAAFHSDALYARLAPAVAPLVAALDDPEEKTRANAAGALGNLVRNGGALGGDLARRGGVGALLNLAARDPSPSPRRIALFSLGTCCAYVPCREALALLLDGEQAVPHPPPPPHGGGGRPAWDMHGRDHEAMPLPPAGAGAAAAAAGRGMVSPGLGLDRRLSELERAATGVGDDVARRYLARLRTKLSAPPQA
ncbi:unnamed protein product, partial [Ectocarpus sp. 8 AP-2014]